MIVIVALLPGPPHPPKVKYWDFCQNDCTISHRKTKKLTMSTLRAISSVTKTHRTLFHPPHPRSFLSQRSTLSTTNLSQSRSVVLRTFLGSTLTVLIDFAHSRENITLKWTLQCHQFNMQGGRCQLKTRQSLKRPLTTW